MQFDLFSIKKIINFWLKLKTLLGFLGVKIKIINFVNILNMLKSDKEMDKNVIMYYNFLPNYKLTNPKIGIFFDIK